MPGFQYWLPGAYAAIVQKHALVWDEIQRHRLDSVLQDIAHVPDDCVATEATIDGRIGVILSPKGRGTEPRDWGYNPTLQTWVTRAEGSDAKLGYEADRLPTPADLSRRLQLGGAQLTDKHEQIWRIPIARSPRGRSVLPAEFVRTPDGVRREIAAAYQDLWDLSGKVRDWVHGEQFIADTDTMTYDWALRVLQANYRVDVAELNLLQQLGRAVLTTETVEPILVAVIDWDLPRDLIAALEKKTPTPADSCETSATPESSSCSPGTTDDSPTTSPAEVP